jgi:hypothetical protein
MKRPWTTVVMIALVLATGVSGCGGGGAKTETQTEIRTTTTGQELTDLKKALDSGVITQQEYEAQRKKILERQ